MKHPIQKLENGRFVANTIVRYLLDNGGIDMNQLAILGFPREDFEQFAQLIGYSLSGFSELGYVSDECYATAVASQTHKDERDARIAALEDLLKEANEQLRAVADIVQEYIE